MDRKLLKTVQTITTFRNRLADPVGTRRGPPLVRGPQFENRWSSVRDRWAHAARTYSVAHTCMHLSDSLDFVENLTDSRDLDLCVTLGPL